MVNLELDSGNRFSGGHPACHVLPALWGFAEAHGATGREFLSAYAVGHEVASRFGRATRLKKGVHAHGTWGVVGAAAAVAALSGANAAEMASAIDTATAMAIAAPFQAAIAGHVVRDNWVGLANVAGMIAWTAVGDRPRITAIGEYSLGSIIGELDWDVLRGGGDLALRNDYYKVHSCCAYAHSAIDVAISIRNQFPQVRVEKDVKAVIVEGGSQVASLSGTAIDTRLGSMFSMPYIVSTALIKGQCTPQMFTSRARADRDVLALMNKVELKLSPEFEAMLPTRRGARVTVVMASGQSFAAQAENAIGEPDHFPLSHADLQDKAGAMLGMARAEELISAVMNLHEQPSLSPLIETARKIGAELEEERVLIA
jgi:2-methylcitrate dehydratase PrpD